MAEPRPTPRHKRKPNASDTIDPKVAAEIMHDYKGTHYRRCLDESIPALEGKTPRQCMRSKKGREKVIEWLKSLENHELTRPPRREANPTILTGCGGN